MNTTHTPGPWETAIACQSARCDALKARAVELTEQNADLLAALREWECYVLHGTSRRYKEHEMLAMTRAAIAKGVRP